MYWSQNLHVDVSLWDPEVHYQYNTFHAYGYGAAPEGALMVGDHESYVSKAGAITLQGGRNPKRQKVAKVWSSAD